MCGTLACDNCTCFEVANADKGTGGDGEAAGGKKKKKKGKEKKERICVRCLAKVRAVEAEKQRVKREQAARAAGSKVGVPTPSREGKLDPAVGGDFDRRYPYTLYSQESLWAIHLLIFVRSDWLEPSSAACVGGLRTEQVRTGLGNVLGNKGAVATAFTAFDTRLCFVSSHLAARATEKRNIQRAKNFSDICKKLFHGDLQFQVRREREKEREREREREREKKRRPHCMVYGVRCIVYGVSLCAACCMLSLTY